MLETIRSSAGAQPLLSDLGLSPPPADEKPFDLGRILGVLRRRKWSVLGFMVLAVGLVLLVTSQLEKRYTATALLAVDTREAQMLGFEPGIVDGIGAGTVVDTQVEIARSSAVLGRAANTLGLVNWPEFAIRPPLIETIGSFFGFGPPEGATLPVSRTFNDLSATDRATLLKELTERLEISRRGLTSIVSISASATTPDGAAQIANAVANAYLQEQIESKLNSTERAAEFLRGRVASLATDITNLEQQIDDFLQTKLAEATTPETRALMTQLRDAARDRDSSAATLSGLQTAMKAQDYTRLSLLVDGQQSSLARQRAALIDEMASTDQQRSEAARTKLTALDAEIRTAAERRIASVQSEVAAAESRNATLRTQVDEALARQQLPKEFSVEIFRLQRDLETRRGLYDNFLTKLGQVEQQTDFNLPDSRVVAAAAPPDRSSYPPIVIIAVCAVVLSFIGGLGLAVLREHYVGGVTSVEQLEDVAHIPILAGVPRLAASVGGGRPDMAIINQPLSAFSEAIRRVRLGVEAFVPKGKLCIFVTSPLPGDGKTTMALALARHAATTGSKTLLIDADMRHPSIHRVLDHVPERSLIDFLAGTPGKADGQMPVIRESSSNLDFILGADGNAIATDVMLMSDRFAELMKFARDNYDVVILDTPPIGLVVDARIVARFCDVGIFVVRQGATSQHHIRSSLRDLSLRLDLPICGILNQIDRSSAYAYGRHSKYGQYYGAA
jgi:capsular exopolysaccharide synthesis family protein